jgi:hypothetical protein
MKAFAIVAARLLTSFDGLALLRANQRVHLLTGTLVNASHLLAPLLRSERPVSANRLDFRSRPLLDAPALL